MAWLSPFGHAKLIQAVQREKEMSLMNGCLETKTKGAFVTTETLN